MLEQTIEQYLVKRVKELGGKAYKFSSPSNKAVPDRLCCFPKGIIVFVECKAPGKVPTPLQKKVHRNLRKLSHEVLVIDTKEKVDIMCEIIKEELKWVKK